MLSWVEHENDFDNLEGAGAGMGGGGGVWEGI